MGGKRGVTMVVGQGGGPQNPKGPRPLNKVYFKYKGSSGKKGPVNTNPLPFIKKRLEKFLVENRPLEEPTPDAIEIGSEEKIIESEPKSDNTEGKPNKDVVQEDNNRDSLEEELLKTEPPLEKLPRIEDLTVAVILDNFSFQCLNYECSLLPLDPKDWKESLRGKKPDFLLVESAWHGLSLEWTNKITNLRFTRDRSLYNIVSWFKSQGIPTVFWNKEDPTNFSHFIDAARVFDYIFTTDENSIGKYKSIVGHDRVFCLPFGAQPTLHNPIDKDKINKIEKFAFAGSWYNDKNKGRQDSMRMMFDVAQNYGLDIYDRNSNNPDPFFNYPREYQRLLKPSINYRDISSVYKSYRGFLNVNFVDNSPTMFSRRVFELLGCGTNVVSSYGLGIENLFKDIVLLCKDSTDVEKNLNLIFKNVNFRDKLSVLGIREVHSKHTYRLRLQYILDSIGFRYKKGDIPGVTVITSTIRESCLDNILKNYHSQLYPKKELIIIINKNSIDLDDWLEKTKSYKDIRIYKIDEEKTLGECLNYGVEMSSYEYISKFDDDNYYAPNFITDLVTAAGYSKADIIGKMSFFIYFEESKTLAINFYNRENRFVDFLSGSAILIDKRVFDSIQFPHISRGEDTRFLNQCKEKGFKLYSADKYNYVCVRRGNMEDHTWKITERDLIKQCKVIGNFDDYKPYVTV